jgi:uncharacterized protein YbjT (DUF2867 family)
MTRTMVVLGATGRVGHVVAAQLLAAGVAVRAVGRSPEKLAALVAKGAEACAGDASDPRFLAGTFRHADGVFVMLPTDPGHPDPAAAAKAYTEAAAAALQVARVPRVVVLSSVGADRPDRNGPIADLYALERRINAIPGIHAMHLRAGYFLENWLANIGLIRSAGINGSSLAPDLPMPMIASRDIGLAAASVLLTDFTGQRTRELQGARHYSCREVTTALGSAIGRPDLAYVQFPDTDLRQAFLAAGLSPATADRYLEMNRGFNEGAIKSLEPRSPATTTATTAEEFARTTFRQASVN